MMANRNRTSRSPGPTQGTTLRNGGEDEHDDVVDDLSGPDVAAGTGPRRRWRRRRRTSRGAGPRLHAGHRRHARRPRSGRLDQLAADPGRLGLQPPRPDRPGQRPPPRPGLVVDDAHRLGAADADRLRRDHVLAGPAQRSTGARRRHRRPALGVPQTLRAVARRFVPRPHAVHRHLRRQDIPQYQRRPHRRPRRADRRCGLGSRGGRQPARLPLHERADRRQREDRRRHDRLRALQGRHLLHLRPRPADRRRVVAHVHRRPAGRSGRRHLGRPPDDVPGGRRRLDSRQLRSGHQPHLLVHLAGQAVGAAVAGHRRRRALHEQRAGARPGHRRARLVLPVRAR